jgi:hypothetical protein
MGLKPHCVYRINPSAKADGKDLHFQVGDFDQELSISTSLLSKSRFLFSRPTLALPRFYPQRDNPQSIATFLIGGNYFGMCGRLYIRSLRIRVEAKILIIDIGSSYLLFPTDKIL